MGGQSQEASIACRFCSTGMLSAILRREPWESPKRNVRDSSLALSMPTTMSTVTRVLVPISI